MCRCRAAGTVRLAVGPELLLLDEPSSGITQPETEALAELLIRVKEHLGATLVIIEHNRMHAGASG